MRVKWVSDPCKHAPRMPRLRGRFGSAAGPGAAAASCSAGSIASPNFSNPPEAASRTWKSSLSSSWSHCFTRFNRATAGDGARVTPEPSPGGENAATAASRAV
jgi:hypothetical protein